MGKGVRSCNHTLFFLTLFYLSACGSVMIPLCKDKCRRPARMSANSGDRPRFFGGRKKVKNKKIILEIDFLLFFVLTGYKPIKEKYHETTRLRTGKPGIKIFCLYSANAGTNPTTQTGLLGPQINTLIRALHKFFHQNLCLNGKEPVKPLTFSYFSNQKITCKVLKKKEIVRTGVLSPVLEITPAQEPEFFTGAGKNAKLHPRWITCRFKVLFTVFCKPGHEDRAERI